MWKPSLIWFVIVAMGAVYFRLIYLNARCAYRLPRSGKKMAYQLSLVFGSFAIFLLQVRLMPDDAGHNNFLFLTMIEAGGGLVILFSTLIREKKAKQQRDTLIKEGTPSFK
jgi:hypothetical protein